MRGFPEPTDFVGGAPHRFKQAGPAQPQNWTHISSTGHWPGPVQKPPRPNRFETHWHSGVPPNSGIQAQSPAKSLPQTGLGGRHPHCGQPGAQVGDCANAGVRRLVSTGAVQAMATPPPIRLSILRREIPSADDSSRGISGFMLSPPLRSRATQCRRACSERGVPTSIGRGDFIAPNRERVIRMAYLLYWPRRRLATRSR